MAEDDKHREQLRVAAVDAVSNLMYTVVFDTVNEIITTAGADQAKALDAANSVIAKYLEGGVKVRKKPAPRAKAAKAPAKDKPVDVLTAASRKAKNAASNLVWLEHPESSEFSYTAGLRLATGFPVRNNLTNKIVMVATEDSTEKLTVKDAQIAMSYGLAIDLDSVSR